MERVPFDIRRVFDDLAVLFRGRASDSVALRFDLDPSIPAALLGDPLRLQQIFISLLDNAFKFTEKGSVTVRAAVSGRGSGGVTLDFAVEDTGIGMSRQQTGEVFSAFNQADNSATRKYGGAGLGLTLTQQMLKLMGGEIAVSSEEGKGSTFSFSCVFPIADALSAPAGDAGKAEDEIADENAVLRGMRVLLVEDNEINTLIATELLDAVGVEVTAAQNGREALDRLKEAKEARPDCPAFDLVLMDLQMPVMDGYEATQHIEEKPEYRDIPIYALTAHALPEERARCFDLGMKEHLTKPIDVNSFYAALREAAPRKS
jgi:CheY-like chemotaxis protein